MTRRLSIEWPDPRPFASRGGEPIRLLAASDEPDLTLDHAINREQLGHIDAVIGCGDLEPDYLGFLGDAFHAPITYVRGNHDRGGAWTRPQSVPTPTTSGRVVDVNGITVVPLEWPGLGQDHAQRDELRAWMDVLRAEAGLYRRGVRAPTPVLVISHAPPRGVGDAVTDPYHLGYAGYRWLLERRRPPLWLHGHTNPASVKDWRDSFGSTVVANVTGSTLVELLPPTETKTETETETETEAETEAA